MPIFEYLKSNARHFPNEVALVEINPEIRMKRGIGCRKQELGESNPSAKYRNQITWKSFNAKSNFVANWLNASGYGKGDRVAILIMNCIEWLPMYFGVLKAGCLAVPLNYRYTIEEIVYCCKLADVRMIIFGPNFFSIVEDIANKLGFLLDINYTGKGKFLFADSMPALVYDKTKNSKKPTALLKTISSEEPKLDFEITDEDDACIYFSSGTTGFPKAILHNHQSLMHAAKCEQKHHGQTHDDVFLCIPPLYHTGAKMHWFGSLISGSRAVLLRGVSPGWIFRTLSEEGCTIVWLLVPWVQDILDAIESGSLELSDYELSQWRLMHIGAQPVPPSLVKRWKKYFPKHEYDTNYGLSESIGPGCVHLGVENFDHVGAIGKAGYGWEAEIRREDGSVIKPGCKDVGELCVKGDGLMSCYYKNKEATHEVLKEGWLYTGDMAEIDAEGFIYLVDRKKDVIVMGGENIYPVEIENFLRAHEAIKDCAVIGIPHNRLGETTLAVVELKPELELGEDELKDYCFALPRYKRPRYVIFESVPRNPTGKIEKFKLREKFGTLRLVEKQIKD
ncbi:MAG: acyl--CoA ligase [Eggerthellaceae bacterium]|nr:acyl--CoA ligase [Eggerthellaceae bacterium]